MKVEVLLPIPIENPVYTYNAPSSLGKVTVGQLAIVPIKNKIKHGIIVRVNAQNTSSKDIVLKDINAIVTPKPLLLPVHLEFWKWLASYYMTSIGNVVISAIPGKLPTFFSDTLESSITKTDRSSLAENFPNLDLETSNILHTLKSTLNDSQVTVFQQEGNSKHILIHLINSYLSRQKSVLILFPNLPSLKAMEKELKPYFKDYMYRYHARERLAKKCMVWRKVHDSKEAMLLLGVQSLLLLPFRNVGLIFVHNEHSPMHKQQNRTPFFHTRDAAVMYAKILKTNLLLYEKTPSFETYKNIKTNKYAWVKSIETKNATIQIIDISEDKRKKLMKAEFSPETLKKCEETLSQSKNILIFKNKLGYSPYLKCPKCGFIPACQRCEVMLGYYKSSQTLSCPYCKYTQPLGEKCIACHKATLQPEGYGLQRVIKFLQETFPNQNIAYVDGSFSATRVKKYMSQLKDTSLRILLSSNIELSKLSFETIGLAIILDMDASLNYPNFRAEERSMQQIFQLVSFMNADSQVIIQTTHSENELFQYLARVRYLDFVDSRMPERKSFAYPPFARLVDITLRHKSLTILTAAFDEFFQKLKAMQNIYVEKPPTPLASVSPKYFDKIIQIKIPPKSPIQEVKRLIVERSKEVKKKYPKLLISFNVDP